MMRIHLAFLLAVFSGASTSLLEGTLLNRAVGQSVSFEAPVFMRGFLQLDGLTIAEVSEKKTDEPPPRLRGRLTWDSQTGLFKISDLNPEDRGVYKVENFDGGVQDMVTFTLEVYDPVSLPQVRVTSRGGTCFLECSVKNGREVTLLLKSRGRTLSHTVDPDLNAPLILHRELSESYSCVASNPASNESVTVHPDQHCGGASTSLLEGTLLNRAVGQSVSFEAPVFMRGFLQLDGLTIAEVSEKQTDEPPPRLRGRLTWDSQTGLFKISDLNPEDRGVYKVENFDGGVQDMVTFTLEVYDPVSLPQVRVTSHGGTCFLECSVKNGREVTLLLKSRGRTLSHTVDPDLNAPLILHRVTKELSESYSCVASNPASNESVTVHPDQYCGGLNTATIILCVMSVSLVLNAVMIIVLMYYKRKMKDEVARRREAEETFFDETVKL